MRRPQGYSVTSFVTTGMASEEAIVTHVQLGVETIYASSAFLHYLLASLASLQHLKLLVAVDDEPGSCNAFRAAIAPLKNLCSLVVTDHLFRSWVGFAWATRALLRDLLSDNSMLMGIPQSM